MITWFCSCEIIDLDSGHVYECDAPIKFHRNNGSEIAFRDQTKRYFSEQVLCGIAHHLDIWDHSWKITSFKMSSEARRPEWDDMKSYPRAPKPKLRVIKGGVEVKRKSDPPRDPIKFLDFDNATRYRADAIEQEAGDATIIRADQQEG